MEIGNPAEQPEPDVRSRSGLNRRVVKVTRRTRFNFEEVYGVTLAELRAKGIDPAEYAREHSVADPAFAKVVAANRHAMGRRLWRRGVRVDVVQTGPPRKLDTSWFLLGMFRGLAFVTLGSVMFGVALDRAVVRRSWAYLGYAAIFLVLVLGASAWMWRTWKNQRPNH